MKKLLRILAVAVLGVGLTTGVASASHGTSSIEDTGPRSRNEIRLEKRHRVRVDNRARVDVTNTNDQFAQSGDARVSNNTNGDDADTGDAENDNETDTDIHVDFNSDVSGMLNGSSDTGGGGSIDNTGPGSDNQISTDINTSVDVENDANVDVENDSVQTAISGDARVSGNTNGGDATTGDATNTNSTSTSISLSF